MKNRVMKTGIGRINLAEMELMTNEIEVFIPITEVSGKLKNTIAKSIEIEKRQFQNEFLGSRNLSWSDGGVNLDYQSLHIIILENRVSYELCVYFTDKENKTLETGFSLEVDLSEHTVELKKLILKALIDKFM